MVDMRGNELKEGDLVIFVQIIQVELHEIEPVTDIEKIYQSN